jgi:hypothetical protein
MWVDTAGDSAAVRAVVAPRSKPRNTYDARHLSDIGVFIVV